jgi:hypothetical protein
MELRYPGKDIIYFYLPPKVMSILAEGTLLFKYLAASINIKLFISKLNQSRVIIILLTYKLIIV